MTTTTKKSKTENETGNTVIVIMTGALDVTLGQSHIEHLRVEPTGLALLCVATMTVKVTVRTGQETLDAVVLILVHPGAIDAGTIHPTETSMKTVVHATKIRIIQGEETEHHRGAIVGVTTIDTEFL